MGLTDSAEYWRDVKNKPIHHVFTCGKGIECGKSHKIESDELDKVDCRFCKRIIKNDDALKREFEKNNGKSLKKIEQQKRDMYGYKLNQSIKFGKFKGKSIKWIIDNQQSYFNWLKDKITYHSEVEIYINKNN